MSRFLLKSAEKSLPFFQILKKAEAFDLSKEYQQVFNALKQYLSSSLMLSKPEKWEALFVYLVKADRTISLVSL